MGFRRRNGYRRGMGKLTFRRSNKYYIKDPKNYRQFEINLPVYVVKNLSLTTPAYSFDSAAAQTTVTNYMNTTAFITSTNEWSLVRETYGEMALMGVQIQFMSWLGGNVVNPTDGPATFPPVYFDLGFDRSNNITPGVVAQNDTAFQCPFYNTSGAPRSKYYKLPPILTTEAGFSLGSQVWATFDSFTSNTSQLPVYVLLGQALGGSFIGTNNFIYAIGSVRVRWYTRMGSRHRTGG